jgi:hypothetical protein
MELDDAWGADELIIVDRFTGEEVFGGTEDTAVPNAEIAPEESRCRRTGGIGDILDTLPPTEISDAVTFFDWLLKEGEVDATKGLLAPVGNTGFEIGFSDRDFALSGRVLAEFCFVVTFGISASNESVMRESVPEKAGLSVWFLNGKDTIH